MKIIKDDMKGIIATFEVDEAIPPQLMGLPRRGAPLTVAFGDAQLPDDDRLYIEAQDDYIAKLRETIARMEDTIEDEDTIIQYLNIRNISVAPHHEHGAVLIRVDRAAHPKYGYDVWKCTYRVGQSENEAVKVNE